MTFGQTKIRTKRKLVSFAIFEPREFRVTGITPEASVIWDPRDLPWLRETPQNFDAIGAAELAIRHQMISDGVSAEDSCYMLGDATATVFWFVLHDFKGTCQVKGTPEAVARFLEDFEKDTDLMAELTGVTRVYRYLYRCDRTGEFQRGLNQEKIVERSNGSSLSLIDLKEIASKLCAKAKRPLLNVELQHNLPLSTKTVTRLTKGCREPAYV